MRNTKQDDKPFKIYVMKTVLLQRPSPQEEVIQSKVYKTWLLLLMMLFTAYKIKANCPDVRAISVEVVVSDSKNSELLPFATIVAYQNKVQKYIASTDLDGKAQFHGMAPGKYDFQAVYVGYAAQEINNVEVLPFETVPLSFKLKPSELIFSCCCFCESYYPPDTVNWWPKLWTPYREAYAEWKVKREKREAKKALQPKKENKTEVKAIDYSEVIVLADPLPAERVAELKITSEEVALFPNPCTDRIHIEAGQTLQQVEIRDANGKLLNAVSMDGPRAEIQLENYSNGLYYLNYFQNGKAESKKFVVMNQ